jgi:hypothetical protein
MSNRIESFQKRVREWTLACFGQEIAYDKTERNHRFLEESLELVQALECTKSEANQLVDYVYARPQGHQDQECGGVLVTLAALCNANGLDMRFLGDVELTRVWKKIDLIRVKQAAKPKHSPLSEPMAERPLQDLNSECMGDFDHDAFDKWWDLITITQGERHGGTYKDCEVAFYAGMKHARAKS